MTNETHSGALVMVPLPRDHNEGVRFKGRRLQIEYLPPGSVELNARNPRKHSPRQIRQLVRSIQRFGFTGAVVTDQNLKVIGGNALVSAARDLGLSEIPIVRVSDLDEQEKQALAIALNQLGLVSEWDDTILAEVLQDLSVAAIDLDIEITGFDMAEIDVRIESLASSPDGAPDPADQVPEVDRHPVVSKEGDCWSLGPHRLVCGSALELGAYGLLMDGEKAASVFTDPPYNVKATAISGQGAVKHGDFVQGSGEMSDAEYDAFLATSFRNLAAVTAPGGLVYACIDWRHVQQMLQAGRATFGDLINLCVWAKSAPGMGSLYRSQHELVCVFRNGGSRHRNNVQLGKYDRNRTNLWSYPSINSFGRPGEEGNLLHLHPTVKPVALVADAILDSTARGDLILDPFCGSGTTIMAAERTGRRCHALELDPRYVDVIIRRWQAYTGDQAHHAASGRAFDDIAAEVREVRHDAE